MRDHLDFDQGGSRLGRLARRLFPDPANPLSWAIPLYRVFGIRVRIHLLFVVYIAAKLIGASLSGSAGWVALVMGMLFVLVLVHEYGHCFACRRVGGEADDILLWPLGGLASCQPPKRWRAELMTTLGGPAVNAALLPVFVVSLFGVTRSWEAVFFNPLTPAVGLQAASPHGLLGQALWAGHYVNALLLAFNMLVPMYPMDAGRTLQALLWRSVGYARAMRITVHVGIVAACVLGVLGIVANEMILLAIAILGGATCAMERHRLMHDPAVLFDVDEDEPTGPTRAELRQEAREREQAEAVERILDKIQREGMESLSRKERAVLEQETRRRRNG